LFYAAVALIALNVSFDDISPLLLVLGAILAVFVADFFSGVVHMVLDYYPLPNDKRLYELFQSRLSGDTPDFRRLQKTVFADLSFLQREAFGAKTHHTFVRSTAHIDYPGLFAGGFPFALPAMAISATLLMAGYDHALIQVPLLIMIVLFANAPLFHAFAHDTEKFGTTALRCMRVAQRLRIANSAERHVVHHKKVDQKFCMITGWADFLVDRLFNALIGFGVLKPGDALLDNLLPSPRT
jgi:hypothetical protein